DPERVVERGYAVVDDRDGNVITSAAAAREAGEVRLVFADAAVDATITEDHE
ncbi:MAG: Exonuclease large subunit, partial [Solirubrobacteraceae bacterium]|nr:Exonuclease large subunit [Solirubrobacteraceae bacterium]